MCKITQPQLSLFTPAQMIAFDPKLSSEFTESVERWFNKESTYDRIAAFDPSVLSQLSCKKSVGFGLEALQPPSARLLSLARSVKCVSCSIEGNVVIAERQKHADTDKVHYNVYHMSPSKMLMMTADHIFPASFGGRDHQDNFQTMCSACNSKKGHVMSPADIDAVRQNPSKYCKPWVRECYFDAVLDVQRLIASETDPKLRSSLTQAMASYNKQVGPHTTPQHARIVANKLTRHVDKLINPAAYARKPAVPVVPPTLWERVQLWVHMTLVKINVVL